VSIGSQTNKNQVTVSNQTFLPQAQPQQNETTDPENQSIKQKIYR
jgi:hypothetical protein